jgi:hypothetical protein
LRPTCVHSVVRESTEVNERRLIDQVVARLIDRFPALDPVTVLWVVQEIHARYDGRPVRDYIPLFVERNAVVELNQLPITVDSRTAVPLGATG